MELIDRVELINIVKLDDYGITWDADAVVKLLESAPAIDAVPVVHAKWIGNNGTFCSNCGKSDANAFNHHIPYCWNCGAYMDGDTNEID